MVGKSVRTIRRWKNEGVEPSRARPGAIKRLQESFELEHKRVARAQARDRRAHPGAPRLEKKVRVLPQGMRRALNEYVGGKRTGRLVESDWINFDVRRQSIEDIHALVRALRDDGRIVQLVYRIPKGGRYPRDSRGRAGKVVSKSTRAGSPPLDLSNLDDGDLMEFLLQYTDAEPGPKSRQILYVAALDQGEGEFSGEDDEGDED